MIDEFNRAYKTAVDDVMRHWTAQMQAEIAHHNVGWGADRYDFRTYLDASAVRFGRAFSALQTARPKPTTVCDVGGFWGVFPVALARLGWHITMTETLALYGHSFDDLFSFITDEGVEILDYDPFEAAGPPKAFDAITLLAVLEHYPHSLRQITANLSLMLRPGALAIIEVPNIAYLPRRLAMVRGESPLVHIGDVYESAVPFTGHHHEFTWAEAVAFAELLGLEVEAIEAYNYSREYHRPVAGLRHPLVVIGEVIERMAYRTRPRLRECIMLTGRAP